tara:strand:+ start:197 stop:433 length:237 start_codon:yes stop_codon:yes gene_type:complete
MDNKLFLITSKYFISLKTNLLDMTINNPIFIFACITVIWFIPGILVRRLNELKKKEKKEKKQVDAINKLYPKPKDFID